MTVAYGGIKNSAKYQATATKHNIIKRGNGALIMAAAHSAICIVTPYLVARKASSSIGVYHRRTAAQRNVSRAL